jgi:HAE1 family hydrophobic/amphiphilic exporter-1
MSLAGIAIRRPVATTMLMISMIFLGIVSMISMKAELLPNINVPLVMVQTEWQGAVPQDVESQITKKIEDVLPNIDGINKIRSTSAFGSSKILVEFDYGADIDMKKGDIQKEVDTIKGELPGSAEVPSVKKIQAGSGTLTMLLNVSGPNQSELTTFVQEFIKPRFERIKGVGSVVTAGSADKQIQVQIDSNKLTAYGLTPTELYTMIQASSINLPLGVIRTGGKEIVARFMGEFNYLDEFKNMVIKSGGKTLRLEDVADIVLTTEDPTDLTKLNGNQSISIGIEKSVQGNTIEINNAAKKAIEELKVYLPENSEINIVMDYSKNINSSISGVKGNAITGLVLATIILMLFLKNVRATILISLALPIAIMFTFVFLKAVGVTINVISLMGLSIGVGMLTDNSVVVIDNIYRHMTELKKPVREASEEGATEVTIAILASSLTTMVVFIPILFIPGLAREVFRDMSYSIIFSNIAALIVSLTLMPMVASRFLSNKTNITSEGKIFRKIKEMYEKIIKKALKYRLTTVVIAFGTFIVMMFLGIKLTRTSFIPDQDFGRYAIVAELQKGLDIDTAEKIAKKFENIVKEDPNTKFYLTQIRKGSVIVNVDIGSKDSRDKTSFEIMDEMRKKTAGIPDTKLNVIADFQVSAPERQVEFRVLGDNLDAVKKVAQKIQDRIEKNTEMVDIKSNLEAGNTEARIVLNRDKLRSYGINPVDVGRAISYSFLGGNRGRGETVTVKTGTEEIDVLVRLNDASRRKMNSLNQLNIKTADGTFIKVEDIAEIGMAEGASEINKIDRVYAITIGANPAQGKGLGDVQKQFVQTFKDINPPKTISYGWGGKSEMFGKAIGQLGAALGISIFLIYAILAAQFESFTLPFIIIGSIPLAMIGVYGGLILTNQPFDLMVMIGIIMLAGTVVNNAIVLIDYIKILRERGVGRTEAVYDSCLTRLRPILMTTMTTVFGMVPLALGFGDGAELYSGMSIAVIFGLSFSTILTLIVIPVLYTVTEDVNNAIKHFFTNLFKGFGKKIRKPVE